MSPMHLCAPGRWFTDYLSIYIILYQTKYLSNRHQPVVLLDGIASDFVPVTLGVPQGSILEPISSLQPSQPGFHLNV